MEQGWAVEKGRRVQSAGMDAIDGFVRGGIVRRNAAGRSGMEGRVRPAGMGAMDGFVCGGIVRRSGAEW
ncbi:MAG: hypothetical protein SPK06_05630 [Kiritimatiellia bacterium]|nr:hypothetical protein [Kiritimatiellia bacterium]